MNIGKSLFAISIATLLAGCNNDSGSNAASGCRTYASSYTDGTINYSATFDTTNKTLTVNDGSNTEMFIYASVEDFVEESKTVGRILLISYTSTDGLSDTLAYDSSKRLIGRALVYGDNTYDINYSEWDSLGRPIQGTEDWELSGNTMGTCFGIRINHAYDDAERTRLTSSDLSVATGTGVLSDCNINTSIEPTMQKFDENSNLIQTTQGSTVTTYTITSVEEQCI